MKALVTASKTLVRAQGDFTLALKADGNACFSARALAAMRRNRVEILYGAIVTNPEFADAANEDYLRFLARRPFPPRALYPTPVARKSAANLDRQCSRPLNLLRAVRLPTTKKGSRHECP